VIQCFPDLIGRHAGFFIEATNLPPSMYSGVRTTSEVHPYFFVEDVAQGIFYLTLHSSRIGLYLRAVELCSVVLN